MEKKKVLFLIIIVSVVLVFLAYFSCNPQLNALLLSLGTGLLASGAIALYLEYSYEREKKDDQEIMRKDLLLDVSGVVNSFIQGITLLNNQNESEKSFIESIMFLNQLFASFPNHNDFGNSAKLLLEPFENLEKVKVAFSKLNLYFANKVFTEKEKDVLYKLLYNYLEFYSEIHVVENDWVIRNYQKAKVNIYNCIDGIKQLESNVKEFSWLANIVFKYSYSEECSDHIKGELKLPKKIVENEYIGFRIKSILAK